MSKLGRLAPTDWEHVEKHPLRVSLITKGTPVVLGINWYRSMSNPQQDSNGRWWIKDISGPLDGGHAICVKPAGLSDTLGWWEFYDQGDIGACVGYSESRMMSLLNRTRYNSLWLYHQAQLNDEWPGENYEGTSVRAGLEILRVVGHQRLIGGFIQSPRPEDGISAYRWGTSVSDVHGTIKMPLADTLNAVPLLNSWGTYYPHIVWLRDEDLDRLLTEDGEAGVITDR